VGLRLALTFANNRKIPVVSASGVSRAAFPRASSELTWYSHTDVDSEDLNLERTKHLWPTHVYYESSAALLSM